ncbi:MAG: hypothetical protein B7Y86_03555 [Brevundimonas subvibrioides]|uniref:Uncharacterized protein n=1 Tax=Brevundimonas subvibrioides TaxID=74313 RepID=A0A258HMJ7_9CAUL|nr:hypothetical protein [Brevundimonas subvibrioides]OYX58096.1 MAG: hypothetical protein B7Y86_03555 [Brevundimonas subvibrioides]
MKVKGFVAVALAYPAAAIAAGFVVMTGFIFVAVLSTLTSGLAASEIGRGLWIAPVAWIYAMVVYLVGLLVIGTPVWLIMARQSRDARRHAVLAGAILSALAGAIILFLLGEPPVAWEPWAFAASLAIPGAVAGWTLHRVAYGKAAA